MDGFTKMNNDMIAITSVCALMYARACVCVFVSELKVSPLLDHHVL